MLKGLGDIGQLMKMQKEMKNIQKNIKKARVSGMCADESVRAVVNGEFSLLEISIDPELIKAGDHKKIEKNVYYAVNDAIDKAREYAAEEMKKIAGGMDLGSLLG
jgi:DNA-binding YbaB/EbfC family protein